MIGPLASSASISAWERRRDMALSSTAGVRPVYDGANESKVAAVLDLFHDPRVADSGCPSPASVQRLAALLRARHGRSLLVLVHPETSPTRRAPEAGCPGDEGAFSHRQKAMPVPAAHGAIANVVRGAVRDG